MNLDAVTDSLSRMLVLTGTLCAPVLGAALVVGIVVGIFQAATQIQESALAFVPKLIAVAGVFAAAGPWALDKLVAFTQAVLNDIAGVSGGVQ